MFGHHAFVPLSHYRLIKRFTPTSHTLREQHPWRLQNRAHLRQYFPPPSQRLTKQAATPMVEQVEEDIVHRTPAGSVANLPRIG
jgi:hypothetical protein